MKLLVINGPNMNMLGIRERDKYGDLTLDTVYKDIKGTCKDLEIEADFFQSNIEGEIINKIHSAYKAFDGIIINPAGLTYYSVSILDALKAVDIPAVEVHMTNIFGREEFRKNTLTAAGCIGVIAGFGKDVYILAVKALHSYINNRK